MGLGKILISYSRRLSSILRRLRQARVYTLLFGAFQNRHMRTLAATFLKLLLCLCCFSMVPSTSHASEFADPTERAFNQTMQTLGFDTQTARFCNLAPAYLSVVEQIRTALRAYSATLQNLKYFPPEAKARHATAEQMDGFFEAGIQRAILVGMPSDQMCAKLVANENALLLKYQKGVKFIEYQTELLIKADHQ